VSGVGGRDGAEQRVQRILERVRVGIGRHLHRGGGDHLHEVVDHDVAQGAHRVVEVAPILHAEALGHGDLDRGDVLARPDRLEPDVGEAQVEDLRHAHLPEEVVDPVQLGLVDVLVYLVGERARGLEVVAERLLDDDARPVGEPGVGEALDDVAEEEGRDLEVEDRRVGVVNRGGQRSKVSASPKSPEMYDRRAAKRSNSSSSTVSPVASIDVRARSRRSATVQSSTATPTIGQSSRPRRSSR
jgi:hypothetical protein